MLWARTTGDDSGLKEVSWQSAFWSLVPLALCCMTQPSGQVLQYPPQLRTYLRISPIVCGLDALAQLVRLSVYLLTGCYTSPAHAVARAMQKRTQSQKHFGKEEGFQALENLTTVRWLLFSFGTLPQAIKLMALRGLFWTKAWGGLYLASFVIMECFVFVGKRRAYQIQESGRPQLERPQSRLTQSPLQRLEVKLEIFETFCGYLALILQISFLGWVFHTLVYPRINNVGTNASNFAVFAEIMVVGTVVWYSLFFLGYVAFSCLVSTLVALLPYRKTPFLASCAQAARIFFVIPDIIAATLLVPSILTNSFIDFAVVILCYIGVLLVLWILGVVLAINKLIRYKVLLVMREDDPANEERNWSIAAWSVFVSTVVLAVCYYAFRYDPSGTYKPKWTDNFG